MFETFGIVLKLIAYLWMAIIAIIPNAFMGGLTFCIVAMVLTYFTKRSDSTPPQS